LKKLDFSKPLFVLAPLAGYTDLPFRSVVKKFGVDLTISEMISSNALYYGSKKSIKMLEKSEDEDPYSVQIAGADVEVIASAVEYLNSLDGIDGIDLNAGCPVPKVVKQGAGSALLNDYDNLYNIVKTIKVRSTKEYTSVKVRIGFEDKQPTQIAKVVEDAGADFIAVHGRTRSGGFKSVVDYDAIKAIKEAVNIPVIANGDIDSYEKAQVVLDHTGADGVMIGRGAIGNPWIFYQLKEDQKEVSQEIKNRIIIEHYDSMIRFYGDGGAKMFRKHLHTYSKGLEGASAFRQKVNEIDDPNHFREVLTSFFRL
jgi:tRNA-dihydrouridine synthase B